MFGEHKQHDEDGRRHRRLHGLHRHAHASIAISCKVGPFSGDATPPAESFPGFVVHIVGKFDGDDVDEAEQLRNV